MKGIGYVYAAALGVGLAAVVVLVWPALRQAPKALRAWWRDLTTGVEKTPAPAPRPKPPSGLRVLIATIRTEKRRADELVPPAPRRRAP